MIKKRKRVLRPSTREESSISYKINTERINSNDTLIVEIFEENNPGKVLYEYEFAGKDVSSKKSIHFIAKHINNDWEIRWSGATPIRRLK